MEQKAAKKRRVETNAGLEGEQGGRSLCRALTQLVDNPELADVRFLVGREKVPVLACHLILSLRSPVFRAMLKGSFKEALPTCNSPTAPMAEVRLPEMEVETFRHLLHFVHTDQLPDELMFATDADNKSQKLIRLYAAADHFMIPQASRTLLTELNSSLTKHNVLLMVEVCIQRAPALLYTLRRFMNTRGAKLLGQHHAQVEQQWLSLSPEAVSQVLKSKLDGVSELQVFEAVHRWYLHQAQQEGFERGCLKKVLGRVKLPLISGLELAEVVEPTGLFSEAQMKEAYKEAATKYRMVQQDPFTHTDKFCFYPQQHNLLRWLISLKTRGPKLALRFATGTEDVRPSAGPPVQVDVYRYRTCVFSAQYAPDDAFVSEGVKEKFKCVSDGLFSVLVHMPRTLFTTIED